MRGFVSSICLLLLFCQLPGISGVSSARHSQSEDTTKFKPNVQVGGFLQVQGVISQDRPQDGDMDRNWSKQLQIWRARFMVGGAVSRKTTFFMQTELPAPLGLVSGDSKRTQSISPILLDAQIEHTFSPYISLIAGMQLVGISRNGLQSPVTLMGLDFGWYQYPYNLLEDQPLQNNFGRDIGVNTRGFLFNDRLEWRLGVFRGRAFDEYAPFRTVARVNYNFFDLEKGLYYTGTNLGKQKLLSVGGGVDVQGSYRSAAADAFLDMPTGQNRSVTCHVSYMHLDGGNSQGGHSFSHLIPRQAIFFTEVGVYFSRAKLQPYLKYETQAMNITSHQYDVNESRVTSGLPPAATSDNLSNFNTLMSNARLGGGLNYFVEEFNFHAKVQYEQISYGQFNVENGAETKRGGEVKLQLTYFIFQ